MKKYLPVRPRCFCFDDSTNSSNMALDLPRRSCRWVRQSRDCRLLLIEIFSLKPDGRAVGRFDHVNHLDYLAIGQDWRRLDEDRLAVGRAPIQRVVQLSA